MLDWPFDCLMLWVGWRAEEGDGACVLVEADAEVDMIAMTRCRNYWISRCRSENASEVEVRLKSGGVNEAEMTLRGHRSCVHIHITYSHRIIRITYTNPEVDEIFGIAFVLLIAPRDSS